MSPYSHAPNGRRHLAERLYDCALDQRPIMSMLNMLCRETRSKRVAITLVENRTLPRGQILVFSSENSDDITIENFNSKESFRLSLKKLHLDNAHSMELDDAAAETLFFHSSKVPSRLKKGQIQSSTAHIKNIIKIQKALNKKIVEKKIYAGMIDLPPYSFIAINTRGEVKAISDSARRILNMHAGIYIERGKLLIADNAIQAALNQTLNKLGLPITTEACSLNAAFTINGEDNYPELEVLLKPHPCPLSSEEDAVLLVVLSERRTADSPNVDIIKKLFGLTNTEARIAILLSEGLKTEEIKDALGISYSTARTHLRAIFHKTGTHRQSAIVRLMLKSGVRLSQ